MNFIFNVNIILQIYKKLYKYKLQFIWFLIAIQRVLFQNKSEIILI